MAFAEQIKQEVLAKLREEIKDLLDGSGGEDSASTSDVTQLKRENTGLRNRVKELEERVTALEKAAQGADVKAAAATATGSGKASSK